MSTFWATFREIRLFLNLTSGHAVYYQLKVIFSKVCWYTPFGNFLLVTLAITWIETPR